MGMRVPLIAGAFFLAACGRGADARGDASTGSATLSETAAESPAAAPRAATDMLLVVHEGTGEDPASTREIRFWSGGNRIARIDGQRRMIGDVAANKLYMVNDETRGCSSLDLRDAEHDPEALEAAVKAVEFRRTGRTERIGDWPAEVHETSSAAGGMPMRLTVWISDAIPVDVATRAYSERSASPETAWLLAMLDLGGYPVRQEVQFGSMRSWSELKSIEKRPAPIGIYEVPTGYTGCE